jgi:1,2-phenylacetyl-CoA epoxidase catalytic subunit
VSLSSLTARRMRSSTTARRKLCASKGRAPSPAVATPRYSRWCPAAPALTMDLTVMEKLVPERRTVFY